MKVVNAQGDMALLPVLVDTAVAEDADLIMTMSTPTLQTALKRAARRPIVFTLVASAVAAGAGKSNEQHLPNVTGVVTTSAYREGIAVLKECMPSARTIGTLFVPGETNSVFNKDRTAEEAQKIGLELIALSVITSAEVPDAANALVSQGIDAICQIAGNLTASSFPSIAQAAAKAGIPIFAFQSNQIYEGASVVIARDYYDGGRETALMAARVMRGEDPSKMPFEPLRSTRLFINIKAAEESGLQIPSHILKRAFKVIDSFSDKEPVN